jgi:hypothetical protein
METFEVAGHPKESKTCPTTKKLERGQKGQFGSHIFKFSTCISVFHVATLFPLSGDVLRFDCMLHKISS